MRAQRVAAIGPQIVIEIAETGGEVDRVDPDLSGPMRQLVRGGQACRVGIDGDVEAAKIGGQLQGCEMFGGQCRHRRQLRQGQMQGEHGLQPFACGQHADRFADANTMAEEIAHGLARWNDRGLVSSGGVKPGAMQAREPSVEVRHLGEQSGPGLGRVCHRVILAPVEAVRVKPEAVEMAQPGEAAPCEIAFGQGARHWLAHGPEPPCRLR